MSAYLSNLLTSTTDRYNALRRNLLASEGDGDTEDDTHICRVLRAYYSEPGRDRPDWLPPDPKKAAQEAAAAAAAAAQRGQSPATSAYSSLWGNGGQTQQVQNTYSSSSQQMSSGNNAGQGAGYGKSALSDLWDPQPQAAASARVAGSRSLRGGSSSTSGYGQSVQPTNVRPLPSQRAGSYQNQQFGADDRYNQSSAGSMGSGGTAQERLKARLRGQTSTTSGRSASPGYGGGSDNRYGGQQGYSSRDRYG